MKLKSLSKRIRRLVERIAKDTKKLAKLRTKHEAASNRPDKKRSRPAKKTSRSVAKTAPAPKKKKRQLSPEARAKLATRMKERWAKKKAANMPAAGAGADSADSAGSLR
jgi:hypothetical protein